MEPGNLERDIAGLAALEDPVRRSLYDYVADRREEVSRDEAAEAVGVSRALAAFHLDRLADAGLLDTSFRRLSGRAGPGAGRPAKLYRRSARQVEVSLPERRYELAATILATAVEESKAPETGRALKKAARAIGERIGAEARDVAGPQARKQALVASAVEALAARGYEPRREPGEVHLRNCPFHGLVAEHKALVCGMNLALLEGVVDGIGVPGVRPVLDPAPGRCCVTLQLRNR